MQLHELSPEEKHIIVDKGTEPPHSGEYEHLKADGVFTCRQCGANLYHSADKFDSHCGWPSFDDSVLGAVERTTDADGIRTEITCRRCQGHLGHVFEGEHYTEKNTRHCVNSLSMRFVPKEKVNGEHKFAYFGGGCFWCTEATFLMVRGVVSVVPGYAGGTVENPTYEAVSSGTTGHAEVVRIGFDPEMVSYEALLDVFFASHDPTTPDRQGHDEGTQYRSIILTADTLQQEFAEKYIVRLEHDHTFAAKVVTEVRPLEKFYEAEDYHHNYFAKNPSAAYCQAVISPKLAKLSSRLSQYLKNGGE